MNIWKFFQSKKVPHIDRSPDEIRKEILNFLNTKYKQANTLDEARVSYSTLKKGLRKIGMTDSEITSNLIYLKRDGWVEEKIIKHETAYEGIEEVHYYCISNQGINFLEGPSVFQKKNKLEGINITNIQGAIVIGDGNIVQNQYIDLYKSLVLLGERVRLSDEFNDGQKLDIQADIDTIKSQLQKLSPDKGIIQKTWEFIKVTVTAAAFVELVLTISRLISHHFS
jgi:hypothetical protein